VCHALQTAVRQLILNHLCGGMQIEKRLETPNPRKPKAGRIAISGSKGVLQMAKRLMAELLQCVEQGFSPDSGDAWPCGSQSLRATSTKRPHTTRI